MNKYVLKIRLIFVFSLFLISNFLSADCDQWHPLFGVNGGLALITNAGISQSFPQETLNDQYYLYVADEEHKLPAMYGGFLGVEWRSHGNWMVQINADYSQSSEFSVRGLLIQGLDTQSEDTFAYAYNMRARQLLGLAKIQYSRSEKISPYLLFGLGASFNLAEDYVTGAPQTIVTTRMYEDFSGSSFSYALGLGFDIHFVEYARLGLGYRFANLGTIGLGQATINSIPVSGTLWQRNLYANEFIAQLTIVF